eukprot:g1827.t1
MRHTSLRQGLRHFSSTWNKKIDNVISQRLDARKTSKISASQYPSEGPVSGTNDAKYNVKSSNLKLQQIVFDTGCFHSGSLIQLNHKFEDSIHRVFDARDASQSTAECNTVCLYAEKRGLARFLLPMFEFELNDKDDEKAAAAIDLNPLAKYYAETLECSFSHILTPQLRSSPPPNNLLQNINANSKTMVVTSDSRIVDMALSSSCHTVYIKKNTSDWKGGRKAHHSFLNVKDVEYLIEDLCGVTLR